MAPVTFFLGNKLLQFFKEIRLRIFYHNGSGYEVQKNAATTPKLGS